MEEVGLTVRFRIGPQERADHTKANVVRPQVGGVQGGRGPSGEDPAFGGWGVAKCSCAV